MTKLVRVSMHPTFIGGMLNGSSFSFFQAAKLKSRAIPAVIGTDTSSDSIPSLLTVSISTSFDADTEETASSEGGSDKKDEKWVSVLNGVTPVETNGTTSGAQ